MKAIAMSMVLVVGMVAATVYAQQPRLVRAPGPGASATAVGTASGTQRASDRSAGCPGYIVEMNDFEITVDRARPNLRLNTESSKDLVLLVQLPDGSYRCDDDSGGNQQPEVNILNPRLGTYRVWIGVWAPNVIADYRFRMSSDT
ncbi:hypothetical protein [Polyangium jinanense]|uniref:Peptidase C-terminal archaeal/bacterial domain-containing protein n=1 Tax=Polyangium jinanense TaxID=2829994 RepID=A0A9X3X779_9BACT|nr:hypothetical protein [Polyangium jinanense]MDC3957563.1 hypothetical protein [Polyangium jinanense]MDC3984947.1 hypothetical protein [Polyangium jinanense]